jgi:hypothetical protein
MRIIYDYVLNTEGQDFSKNTVRSVLTVEVGDDARNEAINALADQELNRIVEDMMVKQNLVHVKIVSLKQSPVQDDVADPTIARE